MTAVNGDTWNSEAKVTLNLMNQSTIITGIHVMDPDSNT